MISGKEIILNYWASLWRDIPFCAYVIGATAFCIGAMICLYRFGIRKGLRWSAGLLLIEYVGLIYCSTVIYRETYTLQYNFMPFWSWKYDRLHAENIMNVLVFVPVGVLPRIAFRGFSWVKAIALGAGLSIGIEVLQFVLSRGFSEVDDVMHNTIGCLIGYGLFYLIRLGYEKSLGIEKQKKKGHYFGYSIE